MTSKVPLERREDININANHETERYNETINQPPTEENTRNIYGKSGR